MFFYIVNWNLKSKNGSQHPGLKIDYHKEIADKAVEIREKTGKPLALVLLDIASHPSHLEMERARMEARAHYTSKEIPCFDSCTQAFSVIRRVIDYYQRSQLIRNKNLFLR